MTTVQAAESRWFDHLPSPRSTPRRMMSEELHSLLQNQEHRVLIVDVRRTDIEPPMSFMLPSAINLPAQTLHQTLPTLIPILQSYSHVVFHCGSSQGRGPRCAAWYQDAVETRGLDVNAYVLSGGIKAYHGLYPEELASV